MRGISLRAWVSGAIIAAVSLHSNAAGLGRLDVKSVLGEPLRAEVAVLAKPGEARSLKVRLSSPDAYQSAGLVYTGIVSQLVVTLGKDAGGQPVINVTSAGPINEPVVDLLLELSWASGRVTREYTAFIDPPFIVADREKRRVQAAVAAAEARAAARGAETRAVNVPDAPVPEPLAEEPVVDRTAKESAGIAEEPVIKDVVVASKEADLGPVETIGGTGPTLFSATPQVSSSASADSDVRAAGTLIGVIRGDTLSKIALANKPAGVTLEQMLVVLLRNNSQAFSGGNMNRLRAGKIIRLADREEYAGVTVAEARKQVRIQTGDWNAYRNRLAAATMKPAGSEQPAQQAAGGAVTPKVEEQTPAPTGKAPEVVKLSKGEPAKAEQGKTGQSDTGPLQEKLIASEKSLKEANDRVTRLEGIIEDLQKLAQVKNQDMAELQNQAGAGAGKEPLAVPVPPATQPNKAQAVPPLPSPTPVPAASTPPPVVEPMPDTAAPSTTMPAKPAEPGQPLPAATGDAGVQIPAPVVPPAPTGEPSNTPPQAEQKPRRRPPPPPPPEPPSLLDRVIEQPYLVAAPLVLILLVGWGVSRLRGRKRESRSSTEEVAPAFAASSGSASAAPGAFSPAETDVGLASSRTGNGADEVDPLEEAEIFLAYGRDAQAEELLKEAIATHPERFEIHVKLLEIYAKQSDKGSFEKLARDVQQGTGGQGELWDRVVTLGYSIDPDNVRYAEGRVDDAGLSDNHGLSSSDLSTTSDRLDFDVGGIDDHPDSSTATDIDLTATTEFEKTHVFDAPTIDARAESSLTGSDLNVELPALDHGGSALDFPVDNGANTVDFDFDIDYLGDKTEASESVQQSGASSADSGLDFNIDDAPLDAGGDEQTEVSNMPALDLSGISLDLDGATTSQVGGSSKDEKWYEVQTKFDLAKAYQEMGDKDGAREILKEVIAEGDSDQRDSAESVLASLD